jgi:hypothetical protein
MPSSAKKNLIKNFHYYLSKRKQSLSNNRKIDLHNIRSIMLLTCFTRIAYATGQANSNDNIQIAVMIIFAMHLDGRALKNRIEKNYYLSKFM